MCTGLQLIIVEQYVQPTIANGLTPWKELQWAQLIERVLKLSLPTVYGWLIMFYSVFHLLLNIIAELTGFEDREFYKVACAPFCNYLVRVFLCRQQNISHVVDRSPEWLSRTPTCMAENPALAELA